MMVSKAQQAEADAAAEAALAESAADASDLVDGDVKGRKVAVDVEGEIVLSRGVDEILRKTVTDGHVTAKDDDELAVILASVPGARRVEG